MMTDFVLETPITKEKKDLPLISVNWINNEDAKRELKRLLDELLKGSNYYVHFGDHLKKKDTKSLYVHKIGFKRSILHIYPKLGNHNGEMDICINKKIFETLHGLISFSDKLLNDAGTQGYKYITVDELIEYVELILNNLI